MHLVVHHRIDRFDPRWQAIDAATFASKNLYNAAMYVKRQAYIHEQHRVISYTDLDTLMQPTAEYRALPAKVAQWVLKQVCAAWDSYFTAVAEWRITPGKFLGHPKNAGWVIPSGVPMRVATKLAYAQIAQVRLVPKATHFVVEVVYDRQPEPASVDPARIASIDLGVNNLAAITSNQPGFVPLLVHGRSLKR